MEQKKEQSCKQNKAKPVLLRILAVMLTTLTALVLGIYVTGAILIKGPSEHLSKLAVMTARETSAMKWVANLYLSEDEITAIETAGDDAELDDTDTSLVQVGAAADDYGLVDDDGDGLILEPVKGPGYVGNMLVVLDPSRVMMGTPKKFGGRGLTVTKMVETYDCIAGINGGGFEDPGGRGTGGIPKGMVILNGEPDYYAGNTKYNFIGFDDQYILHTGKMNAKQAMEKKIQFGCTFGPVLVVNGEKATEAIGNSGVNPRTAIGQRGDGAVLMLVIDGRQAHSMGATYEDLADIMMDYGAVNACNLDGGSSSVMWFEDGYINSSASLIGDRPLPTGFLVKK